jgi:hypothetical protein
MTLIGDVGDRSRVADVDLKLILDREDAPRCQRIRGCVSCCFTVDHSYRTPDLCERTDIFETFAMSYICTSVI